MLITVFGVLQPSCLSLGRQGELPVGQEKAPWGGWHRAAMTERGITTF